MSAPYWGELPNPKIARGNRSSLQASGHDNSMALDPYGGPSRTNRSSSQTAASDSTFGPTRDAPHAGPSPYPQSGLAPRPPSYHQRRPAAGGDSGSGESMNIPPTRRSSRSAAGSGAAGHQKSQNRASRRISDAEMEVPNYHQGYQRRSSQPNATNYVRGEGRGDGDIRFRNQEEYQQHNHHPREGYRPEGSRHNRAASMDYAHNDRDAYGSQLRQQPDDMVPVQNYTTMEEPVVVRETPRALSNTGVPSNRSAERRRKFADHRSPLQRLELTLDSISKEEKRARVEAAERRARERAAQKNGEASGDQPKPPQPRSQEEGPGEDTESDPRPSGSSVAFARGGSVKGQHARKGSLTRNVQPQNVPQQYQAQQYGTVADESTGLPPHNESNPQMYRPSEGYGSPRGPRQMPPGSKDPKEQVEEGAGIQRNLSFRDRAKAQATLPAASQHQRRSSMQASAPGGVGVAPRRAGSNKLQKVPPGDPWYHQRMEAERYMSQVNSSAATPQSGRQQPSSGARDPGPSRFDPSRLGFDDYGRMPQMPGQPMQGIQRSATEPIMADTAARSSFQANQQHPTARRGVAFEDVPHPTQQSRQIIDGERSAGTRRLLDRGDSPESTHNHRLSGMVFKDPKEMSPGNGLYKSPEWLDEWRKASVGTLTGSLLDLRESKRMPLNDDKDKAWWERGGAYRGGVNASKKAQQVASYQQADDAVPTKFQPELYLRCGPLLRYLGTRTDKVQVGSTPRDTQPSERTMWRGSVMIVTQDSQSSYETVPTLKLFAQDLELLPTPPQHVDGDLSPEHVDPLAGHPRLGRGGETLFVRPVEHLEEAKNYELNGDDYGVFEKSKSPADSSGDERESHSGTFTSRKLRSAADGEMHNKYKEVSGFRLHAERGCTFWRFNIEVELGDRQRRIGYRINQGQAMAFWVPAREESMHIMFHSCNGFSSNVDTNDFSGPDPMWRDVLNNHQSRPFHLMVGGGDQIYNDSVSSECALFDEWLDLRNPVHKHNAAFTPDMQEQMETFYLERYCKWFSQGLFGLATSQIPMVNMYDDHDIFDGYGSYPHHDMTAPVFTGLGAVAFKYYMLFQHQSIPPETETTEPSWIIGMNTGPYIKELSRSVYVPVGPKVSLLAVDTRTERTEHDVVSDKSWEKIMNRLYAEVRRGQVEHLLVVLGVPIAYPRLDWLENILTSRLLDPVKLVGRSGMFGKVLNNIDGGVEVLDDLNDHWTAKNHKHERSILIEDLQDLAIDKSLRVTILSGDVHLAAVGSFYSNPKLGLAKHKDPRYMPNVVSSAIVNAPPPDMMADVLNRRNKVHHFDAQTDEAMLPMFQHGVDGKPRNNKHLLPHRNWCSIRQWVPGNTPPPTPPMSRTPSPPPSQTSRRGSVGGSLMRRLSLSSRGRRDSTSGRPDVTRDSVARADRPPVSRGGGLLRRLSNRMSSSSNEPPGPGGMTRSMSLDRGAGEKRGFFGLGRRNSRSRPDDGGINGQWGEEDYSDEEPYYYQDPQTFPRPRPSGLRGGAVHDEYSDDDESYFSARPPPRAQTFGGQPGSNSSDKNQFRSPVHDAAVAEDGPPTRPFHRTPTGLSAKQMKRVDQFEVDLEGGLDICLNVEVNPKDPAGITVPYRLLVPKLLYEYSPEDDQIPVEKPASSSGIKRFLSLRGRQAKEKGYVSSGGRHGDDEYDAAPQQQQQQQYYEGEPYEMSQGR